MDPCEHREEQLSALLDGELSVSERQELLEHLSGCDACRNYLADLTAIGEALEAVPAPEDFAPSVMDQIRRTRQPGRRKPVRWQRWGLLAACCALVLLGVWSARPDGVRDTDAASPAARSAAAGTRDVAAPETPEDASAGVPEPQSDLPEEPLCGAEAAGAFSMEAQASPAWNGRGELLDCETASELFGHPLAPCTRDGFEGYSLGWVGDGENGDVIYTYAVYHFANGTASVRDQDREGYVPPAEDSESVVYQGETFYVRDALHGDGRPVVVYFPNGETGLSYSARFDPDVGRNEVFELLLSLRIP